MHPPSRSAAAGSHLLAAGLALVLSALPLAAQTRPEVVRGTVTGADGSLVRGATVAVTRAPDRLTETAQSDSLGRYSVSFAEGTGDYLVHVSAMGWKDFRQRATRTGGDPVLVVDAKLATAAIALAPVAVQAQRPKPSRGRESMGGPGATDTPAGSGVYGLLSPDQAADLDRLAATTPGVTGGAGGLSALGLAGQTSYTLNGMGFDGGSIPRGMRASTRVSLGTYDPARGGFGAAEVSLELSPGNVFTNVDGSFTGDARQLQASDGAARRLGREYTGMQLDLSGSGELKPDRYYFNTGVQATLRQADAPSLFGAAPDLLRLSGVAADSAARLREILGTAQVPVAGAAPVRTSQSVTLLGRLDRTPGGRRALGLTAYGSLTQDDGTAAQPTATAGHARRSQSARGQVQGLYSFFFGREYLNETQSAFSFRSDRTTPYLGLPEGRVLVGSAFEDGTDAVSFLAFGGGGAPTRRQSWRWETTDQLQLYTRASLHKLKVYAQSRLEGYSREASVSPGAFTYSSLADVAANRPASFSRTLLSPGESGGEWSGALALADLWKVKPLFRVMYGARLEGNRFTSAPAANGAVRQAFGARTDRVPNTVHVSPRVGFTWTYVKGQDGRYSYSMGPLGEFQHGPSGVLRGGIGEFRSALRPDLLSRARTATGLPGGEERLFCAGGAVPVPDWSAYADDPASIPTSCAGAGQPALTDAAPAVELFAPGYTAARSWRASLGWSSSYRRLDFTVDGIYSLNRDQPGFVDLNFTGAPAFTLPQEGGRPVYVPAGDVVPATGVVPSAGARRVSAFGHVYEQRSDLRSRARQLSVTASPRVGYSKSLSVTYTLADVRAQERGFGGSTFGDPRSVEWSAGAVTPRHQVMVQGGIYKKGVALTLSARAYSGLPYTPLVGGDVNGDGLANDRAFVFDPAAVGDAALAAGMRDLLDAAPPAARDCLRGQLGRPADRNSCASPWSVSTNARLGLSSRMLHLPGRMDLSLNLANPLVGADRLVHGANGLHSWGTAPMPEATLLYVRGFDPATRSFRYDVNPRFGATSPALGAFRDPFRLTVDVHVRLGTDITVQQLRRVLRPGRGGNPGTRLTAEGLRDRYARNVPSLYSMILELSDSLLLTPQQVQALQHADAAYRVHTDSVWMGLGTYLAALPDPYDARAAVKRQEEATDAVWMLAKAERPIVERILSPLQLTMLPQMVTTIFNLKPTDRIRYFMG